MLGGCGKHNEVAVAALVELWPYMIVALLVDYSIMHSLHLDVAGTRRPTLET